MKVVRKLLAPLLVVGILLTSLISLHQLKADKKKDVFRIGISQFITHQSLDATRAVSYTHLDVYKRQELQ